MAQNDASTGGSERYPHVPDADRREEIAKDALEIGMRDPYWLCNFHGRCKLEDLLDMAKELEADAELLRQAHDSTTVNGWTPAESALYIAENANFGEYDTHDHLYDSIPITTENFDPKDTDTDPE